MSSKVLNKDSVNSQFHNSIITMYNKKTILKTIHNAGFFSCCSIKLNDLIVFYNVYKRVPDEVDSSTQFNLYKKNRTDITYDYFKEPLDVPIVYKTPFYFHHDLQFTNYNELDLTNLIPFIQKYFTPSDTIIQIKDRMKQKYQIDTSNTCVLFYRGNDKNTETGTCSYEDMIVYGKKVQDQHPDVRFMIQSDETEFITTMSSVFPNSFVCKDEIRHINKQMSSVDYVYRDSNSEFSKNYLAITLLMAECNYVVCGSSGNCSIWIVFYRQHTNNVYQFHKGKWIVS